MSDEFLKNLITLYGNQAFKSAFAEFLVKMQQDGMSAAKNFWNVYPQRDSFFKGNSDIIEQMINFYTEMGFVPRKKYDAALKEIEELKKENAFLKETMQKFNLKVIEEGGKTMQEAWKDTVHTQMEVSKDFAKTFFDIFKDFGKK